MATRSGLLLPLLLAAMAEVDGEGPVGALRGRLSSIAGSVSNRVLLEVDVNGMVQRLDVEALLARIDVNEVLARADLNAVLARVDLNALFENVDLDPVLARMDVNAVLERVDMDDLLGRVDLQRVLARVELDPLLAAIDVSALMDRIDLDAVLARVDLKTLVQRAGIPELVANSTGQLAGSALDLARRQLVGLDVGVWRGLQRLFRRDPDALPSAPATLVHGGPMLTAPDPESPRVRARQEVSGFYAGPVSRVLAFAGDLALANFLFAAGAAGLSWLLSTVFSVALPAADRQGLAWLIASGVWLFLYWSVTSALVGRTPVMGLAGLRIVSRDGRPLKPHSAFVRTILLPFSLLFFGIGGAWMVVDRERRGLHDLGAGSTVVYDWGGRAAQMPTPLANWISTHSGDMPAATPPPTATLPGGPVPHTG